jgi:hypothetical protein
MATPLLGQRAAQPRLSAETVEELAETFLADADFSALGFGSGRGVLVVAAAAFLGRLRRTVPKR